MRRLQSYTVPDVHLDKDTVHIRVMAATEIPHWECKDCSRHGVLLFAAWKIRMKMKQVENKGSVIVCPFNLKDYSPYPLKSGQLTVKY